MSSIKQKQKFESDWKKLSELTNSENPEKSPKVASSEVVIIFKEIAEERIKKAREVFKIKLAGILEAKLALDKTLQKGRNELVQKEEKEYEALNKELNEANQLLENAKNEGQTLTNAAEGKFEEPKEE